MGKGAALLALLGCLAVTGCGDAPGERPAGAAQAGAAKIPAAAPADAARRPKPEVPRGRPSSNLVVTDLVRGTGEAAEAGDVLLIRYVAGIYETGREIESAGRPEPVGFLLGSGDWSVGFESGMPGMRVGGRRVLIFPTTPATTPPGSELGDTLVYVVDLLGISEPGGVPPPGA